jgi:hypothetical protein
MMRVLGLVYFLVLWVPVYSANFEELFLQANNLYRSGKFEEALQAYELIENKGWGVLYNMGACWYHLNNYVEAYIHLRRAQKAGGMHDPLVLAALQELSTKFENNRHDVSFMQRLQWWTTKFSIQIWQFLVLMSWMMLIVCLRYVRYRKRLISMCITLGLFGSISGLWLRHTYHVETNAIALESAPLLVGKDERFEVLETLRQGQEVTVLAQEMPWLKIKNNGKIGWILGTHLALI